MWVVRLRSGHIDDYIGVVGIVSRVSRIPLLNPRLSRKNRGTVAPWHQNGTTQGEFFWCISAVVFGFFLFQ